MFGSDLRNAMRECEEPLSLSDAVVPSFFPLSLSLRFFFLQINFALSRGRCFEFIDTLAG